MKGNILGWILIVIILLLASSYYVYTQREKDLDRDLKQYKVTDDDEVAEEVDMGDRTEEVVQTEELPKIATIEILHNIFSPKTLEVEKGTTVVWVNKDTFVHQIKHRSPEHLFHSERIEPNQSFSYRFNSAGEYKYIDTIHTYMQGEINVKGDLIDITGNYAKNVIEFSKIQKNVVTLLLFIALGFTLISFIEEKSR